MNDSKKIILRYTALLFLIIGSTLSANAQGQAYFWVGGNGLWNNPDAWSLVSGGPSIGKVPSQNTNVVFDEQGLDNGDVVSIPANASCNQLQITTDNLSVEIQQDASLTVYGNFHSEVGFASLGDGIWVFHSDTNQEWDSGNAIFSGDLRFEGTGNIDLQSHVLTQNKEITISCNSFDSHGYFLTCGTFNMPGSTEINVQSSTIFVTEGMQVADEVRVTQDSQNVLISNGVDTENFHPGAFDVGYAANRTATCGTGVGETPFTITASVISDYNGENISCNGANDGEAFVTVSGGVGPFSFQWIGGNTPGFSQNYPNLGAGTYTVLVTDLGQGLAPCVDNVQLTEPAQLTLFSFNYIPPTCFGLCDGIGTPIVIGGVPSYSWSWSNGETTQMATMLCEGNNTMTVTDLNGCLYDSILTVQLNPIFANVTVTDVFCGGTATGNAVSNPSGGTGAPYTWAWSTGDTGNSIVDQNAGTYTLNVADPTGCSVDTTIVIAEQPPLLITLVNQTDISCNGFFDGAIDVSVTNGTPNYSYSWVGPNGFTASSEDISNLEAGVYSLTVVDANACSQSASFTLTAPAALDLSFVVTDILCAGDSNGAIDLTVSGGVPVYSHGWSGPNGFTAITEDLTGLQAGIYTVLVADFNLCTAVASVEVLDVLPIDAQSTVTPILCNGANDGAINLTLSGGNPGYVVSWTGPNGFTSILEDIVGLEPGDYTFVVTDLSGCTLSQTITVPDAPALDVQFVIGEISCSGSSDGFIDATLSGGTPPYTTDWVADNGFTSTAEDIFNLAAGTYVLTLSDSQGCFVVYEVILNDPLALTLMNVVADVSCGGLSDGAIDLTVLGGTPTYTFSWSGPNGFTAITEDISNLEAGDYTVVVTDAAGCADSAVITVVEPPVLVADLLVSLISCNAANDGAVDLTLSGGQPPYSVLWTSSNGFMSTSEDIANLAPGVYDLLVDDLNGCFVTAQVDLTEPAPIVVDVLSNDPSCNASLDGSINLTISGGVVPYQISWNTGDNGTSLSNLAAGDYSVTVTDDVGCQTIIDPITLLDPDAIILTIDVTDIACGGVNSGAIDLSISGGVPNFTVAWTGPNGFTSSALSLTNLEAGVYDVLVTDSNGCQTSGSVEVMESPLLQLDAVVTPILCNGDLGAIDLTITGGLPPYTINWSSANGFSSTNEDIIDLPADAYTVDITDLNGCVASQLFNLNEPLALVVDATVTSLDCSGLNNGAIDLTLSGGTPDYNVSWTGPSGFTSSSTNLIDLEAGTYSLTLTDANGCIFTDDYEVLPPDFLTADALMIPPLCFGTPTGAIALTLTGGTPSYSILWTGPNGFVSPTEDIGNLMAGSYSLHVEDSGSCVLDSIFVLDDAPELTVATDVVDVLCSGSNTGAIHLVIGGGTGVYNVGWSGPNGYLSSGEDIMDLEAGVYDLIVVDGNFCTVQMSVTVGEGALVDVSTGSTNSTCGSAVGEVWVSISGGLPPVLTTWYDESMNVIGTDTLVSGLNAGLYTVDVTDATGCGGVFTVPVSDSNVADVSANITDVLCFGDFNGAINLAVSNGTEPYSISWSGPNGFTADLEDISDLEAGNYVVNIIDGVGCEINQSFEVGSPGELILDVIPLGLSCSGQDDGSIDLTVVGGTPPFNFAWSGPNGFVSTDEDISNLAAGSYVVLVSDAHACSATGFVQILETEALTATAQLSSIACFGDNNGQIDITVGGGLLPYSFAWTGPNGFTSGNEDLLNLQAGEYFLSVIDDFGCSLDTSFTILENLPILIDLSITQPLCQQSNGILEATVTGGVVANDYTYAWYDANTLDLLSTGSMVTNLSSGQYSLEVSDDLMCTNTMEITLTDADGSVTGTVQDALCFGAGGGTIDITVANGTPDYTYSWGGPSGYVSSDEDLVDLIAGSYQVMVTDALGCLYAEVFVVEEPEELGVSFVGGNISCAGESDAAVLTNISGGTPNYNVSWTGPDGFSSTSTNLSNLAAGCYDITVVDANLCSVSGTHCVDEPTPIVVDGLITDNLCYSASDGAVQLDVAGGTPFYTYMWVGPGGFTSSSEDLTNLLAGAYDLQIMDQNQCILDTLFMVSENDSLGIIPSISLPGCPGDANGTIMLEVFGGTPDYGYSWTSTGGFTSDAANISDLIADVYTITVLDALGCSKMLDVDLPNPDSLHVVATVSDISCFESIDGSIAVEISGGNTPYSYSWTGPNAFSSNNVDINNLEQGSYELIVNDLFLCADTLQFQIVEPPAMQILLDDLNNTSCPDSEDGAVYISVEGGMPDFTFDWQGSNGFSGQSEDVEGLNPGIYTLVVTDANGCQISLNEIPIVALGDALAVAPPDFSACFGTGSWTLVGENTGGQTESWLDDNGTELSSGSDLTVDPEPGIYTYIFQAVDGPCVSQDTVVVEILSLPLADAGPDQNIFLNESATLGGNPSAESDHTVVWTPATLLDDSTAFNPTTVGLVESVTFTLTVTDPFGCTSDDTVDLILVPELDVPDGFTPNADGQNDLWEIGNLDFYNNAVVEVYNRWGDLIWSNQDSLRAWDGNYRGSPLPIGTYYYVININEPEFPDAITGPVTILR